jgi:FkbM family methyltransferase
MNILKTILKDGYLVFDVGCNIGEKANYYLQLNTKVVGFEPQPKCVNALLKRFKDNDNIVIEPIGLDKEKGVSVIYEASHDTISSMSLDFINTVKKERFSGYNWGEKIDINIDTLDNMILKHGKPNYIKIDVEGYELNVLQGLTTPIDIISVEFTPELCQSSVDCVNYIESINGECVYNYGYREDLDFKFDTWLNKQDLLSYIESVKDFSFEFGDIYVKIKDKK